MHRQPILKAAHDLVLSRLTTEVPTTRMEALGGIAAMGGHSAFSQLIPRICVAFPDGSLRHGRAGRDARDIEDATLGAAVAKMAIAGTADAASAPAWTSMRSFNLAPQTTHSGG
jgi:hypothetical protein